MTTKSKSKPHGGPGTASLSLLKRRIFELNQIIKVLEHRIGQEISIGDDISVNTEDIDKIIHSLEDTRDTIWLPLNRIRSIW